MISPFFLVQELEAILHFSSHTLLNMAFECLINYGPLHLNITANDWATELDRVDTSRQTSFDGKIEH